MNDLVVGVILKADGRGLVGQLQLSEKAHADLTAAQRKGAAVAVEFGGAQKGNANASRQAGDATARAAAQTDAATQAMRAHKQATDASTRSLGAQRAGYQQVGFQLQDAIIQAQMGTSAFVILGQQGGQLAQAFALMGNSADGAKGKFAKFAGFMGGPWGAAITVGVSLAGALATALLSNSDATDKAENSTINFSNSLRAAQGLVADYADEIAQLEQATRGLINTQALMIDNTRLFAQTSVAQLETQLNTLDREIADRNKTNPITDFLFGGNLNSLEQARLRSQRNAVAGQLRNAQNSLSAAQTAFEARDASESADPKAAARAQIERDRAKLLERRQYTLQQGPVPFQIGGLELISEADFRKQMSELERRKNALNDARQPKKDNSAEKAAREAKRLADYGDSAAESIARLNDQFNRAPKEVDTARAATAKLDAIIKDLQDRKPPNFQTLIDQAKEVKPLIEESLQRPIRDMLDDQQKEIDIGRARLTGRQSEVDALQLTYQLMAMLGVESKDQLATELAKRGITEDQVRQLYDNLNVMRAQTREMEAQRAEQEAFLRALDGVRGSIQQTLADLRTRGPKAIGDLFKDLLHVADNLFADVLTEQIFGKLFRDLEDQVTGANKVSRAGEEMARSVHKASDNIGKLGAAAAAAADKMNGSGGAGKPTGGADKSTEDVPTITVTGNPVKDELKKTFKEGFKEAYEGVFKEFKAALKSVFEGIFGEKGPFSASLGKMLGQTLANAQIGATVGKGVTDALGLKGSSTGGAIGGAVGGAIGTAIGGPLGQAIGSVIGGTLGSVVGGLFKKTPWGTAVVTGQGKDDATITGNKAAARQAATGAAGSIQDGLQQIAEAFGGDVGGYNVSIGTYKGKWRVSTSGYGGKLKVKNGAVDFGKDGAEQAIAFAITDAIADGAIQGVSAAVSQALRSSSDLNDAIQEALKVREVEDLLGGIGAQLERQFRAFETQTKERLRIANQYGFDVIAIEKRNAEDRARLVDDILAQRIGGLQGLLDDLKFGNLFEGSAADQRQALLLEVAKAQADANAGVDGAADKLAELNRRLVELSRDAFGTAGGQYASDRSSAISSAESVIAAENGRIKATQDAVAATNAKLDKANDLGNEANDLLVQINTNIAALGRGAIYGQLLPALDTAAIARGYGG